MPWHIFSFDSIFLSYNRSLYSHFFNITRTIRDSDVTMSLFILCKLAFGPCIYLTFSYYLAAWDIFLTFIVVNISVIIFQYFIPTWGNGSLRIFQWFTNLLSIIICIRKYNCMISCDIHGLNPAHRHINTMIL